MKFQLTSSVILFCFTVGLNKLKVNYTLLTKTTAAQNEDALSYPRVRGLYFQAVVFVATIYIIIMSMKQCYY